MYGFDIVIGKIGDDAGKNMKLTRKLYFDLKKINIELALA